MDEAALAGWEALRRGTPGEQPRYSDLAIELMLTLRLVFHLVLRQAEGFAHSVLALLGLDLAVPDHTTLSEGTASSVMQTTLSLNEYRTSLISFARPATVRSRDGRWTTPQRHRNPSTKHVLLSWSVPEWPTTFQERSAFSTCSLIALSA